MESACGYHTFQTMARAAYLPPVIIADPHRAALGHGD